MKNHIYKVIPIALISIVFQACGQVTSSGGFTEENIDVSQPALTPGIQEGLCEQTADAFTFKSKDGAGNGVTFSAGTGIMIGPDGQEYEAIQEKSVSDPALNQPYPCTMEIFENGDVIFESLAKTSCKKYILMCRTHKTY